MQAAPASSSWKQWLRSVPGLARMLDSQVGRGFRHPACAWTAVRGRLSQRPTLVIFSVLPQHRASVNSVVECLPEQRQRRFRVVLLNSFPAPPPAQRPLRPAGMEELFGFPLGFLKYIPSGCVLTAASGLQRSQVHCGSTVVHFMHSLGGLDGLYLDDHFDDYDYIVCGGSHHVQDFQARRLTRPILAGKGLIPGGYPKLDQAIAQARREQGAVQPDTVVYAPTLTLDSNRAVASFQSHGHAIVATLLNAGWRVIFRPHPYARNTDDRPHVERIAAEFASHERFSLDQQADQRASYGIAAMMVSDFSGAGFTFAFTYGRPVAFFAPHAEAEAGLRGVHFEARHRLGGVARSVEELAAVVGKLRANAAPVQREIEAFRAQLMFNLGGSAAYCSEQIQRLMNGEEPRDVIRL